MKNSIFYYLIILYLILGILGYRIGWSSNQYDELRLLQFPLALLAFLYILFFKKLEYKIQKEFSFITITFLVLFPFYILNIFLLQELVSIIMLMLIILALMIVIRKSKKKTIIRGLMAVVLSALIPCLFLVLSIIILIFNHEWLDWQLNSGSIRIFDSVIVPLLFFLILLKKEKIKYINLIYPIGVVLFSLAWFFDGARSALLASVVGIIFLLIFSLENRKKAYSVLFFMFFSFLIYKGVLYFSNHNAMTVLRSGTSLRIEMWSSVYNVWRENPIIGVGGGYLSRIQYDYGYHMHNLYLRLIFEWGIQGIIFLLWLLSNAFLLFRDKLVDPVLKAGFFSILIDAMFSGNMIYPLSQIACVLFISIAFSQKKATYTFNRYSFLLTKITLYFWGAVFIYISIFYFKEDLSCWNCNSYLGRMAPNFWIYGGSEHLIYLQKHPN